MRIINENIETLKATVVTVYEDLDLPETIELCTAMTSVCRIGSRPFKKVNHSLQMEQRVYDFSFDYVYYIVERIFRDEDSGYPGKTAFITYIEHTYGGDAKPETIEWTVPLDEFLHEVVGLPNSYQWN